MMKKITLVFIFLISIIGYGQQQIYTLGFEAGTADGNISTWDTFEATTPAPEIVTNPNPNGVNTSATTQVLKLNVAQAGDCFAGVGSLIGALGTWELNPAVPSNLTLSMDIHKNIVGPIGIKMATTTNGTTFDIPAAQSNTLINEWQTLTWDLTGLLSGDNTNITQLIIYMDFTCGNPDRAADVELYVDNITFGANKLTDPAEANCSDGIQNGDETGVDCGGPDCAPCSATQPLTAAPTPTLDQSQVINMYSNAYTQDVNVSSWRSGWSTSTYTDNVLVDGPGSETKRYIDADFVGVEFYSPNALDATGMNYFHLDVWSPNATVFRVKLVDLDAGVVEGEIAFNIAQGQWVKLDIPLADFADPTQVTNPAFLLTSRNSIQQLIFSGQPVGTFDFYVDNIYFATDASLSTTEFETTSFNVYPNPSQTEWTVNAANSTITSIQLFDVLGKQVLSITPNTSVAKIDASQLTKGLYFANIISDNGTSTVKLIKN